MKMSTRRILSGALLGLTALAATAADYPDRPIKMVLPFPAGSATDGVTRVIAGDLLKELGEPVIVENQAGADGIIAAQFVKRATADGYTLFVSTNSAHGSNPALYNHLPYDPEKDFVAVAGLIRIPLALMVRKDFPANDVATFVKVAKQRAGAGKPMSYGAGNTSNRVAAELTKKAAGLEMTRIPYRGTPPALQDLISGQVDVMFVDPFSAMAFIHSGQLKVLAVMDDKRHPMLPNVPTMEEAGYKNTAVVSWAAVFAPAGTPPAVVDRLSKAINHSLALPATEAAIQRMAMSPMVMTPIQLRDYVHGEIPRWGKLVDIAAIPKQ